MGTDSQGMMRLFSSYVSTDEFCYMLNEVAPLEEALDMDLLNQVKSYLKFRLMHQMQA